MEQLVEFLPILIPLLVLELGMRIYAIIDIIKLEEKEIKTRWFQPVWWIVIVAVINFGWLFYLIAGKEE